MNCMHVLILGKFIAKSPINSGSYVKSQYFVVRYATAAKHLAGQLMGKTTMKNRGNKVDGLAKARSKEILEVARRAARDEPWWVSRNPTISD